MLVTWIVVGLSVIVGAVGILVVWSIVQKKAQGQETWDHIRKFWWLHLFELIFGALVVFGVTGAIGEVGLLSDFFKRQVGDVFVSITTDPEYMREHLGTEGIRNIRDATTEALFGRLDSKLHKRYLDIVENRVYSTLGQPLRKDFTINLDHTIVELADGRKALRVWNQTSWENESDSDDTIQVADSTVTTMENLPGISKDSLYVLNSFRIDGKNIDVERIVMESKDGQTNYSHKYSYRFLRTSKVEITSTRLIPYQDNFTQWMRVPTYGLTITYHHPATFKPRVYVFGLGNKQPEPLHEKENQEKWEYEGWLLEKHGVILYWTTGSDK